MFKYYFNAFLFVSQVYMTTFSPDSVCRHNTERVYLDDDAESGIMEEVSAGGCSCVYFVDDFSSGRLPEDE